MDENGKRNFRYGFYERHDGNDNNSQALNREEVAQPHQKPVTVSKNTSLGTLIVWNISKALEKDPHINLRSAMYTAQLKLGQESGNLTSFMSQHPEERYLICATLAWQRLGHENADSLCCFYETNKIKHKYNNNNNIKTDKIESYCSVTEFKRDPDKEKFYSTNSYILSNDTFSTGPVVKLPVQKKIVMRLENTPSCRRAKGRKYKMPDKNLKDKIDAACCLKTDCIQRLATVDATTSELRNRVAKLARREAERIELLERAEAAWKDLEIGYQRRLRLAEEKEDDLSKQIQKLIEERNGYKNACMNIVKHLKRRAEIAEKDREALAIVEKQVYDRAYIRLRLGEESARADAILTESQIKAAQLDRDLQFKEEQARHKVLSIESEVSSARALTHDAERAMRAELGALREQVAQVSSQLLEEDAENDRLKEEIDALDKEKMEMVEDLDGCKLMCDNRMQGRIDELQEKRAKLNKLKDKVIECRCQLPVDANVEVKRTPSFAALCKCRPEDRILKSCSCTSLRSTLLSNLLADLFGGLQAEMSGSVSQMPCQLLKCLEDKHNWDRASIAKTNLQIYFSQLLVSELDIAIATSIHKYHAKWVGSTCADRAKLTAQPGDIEDDGWEKRVLEERAQKLASELAEQLSQEIAEQLTQRAKDIVKSGPPPCACKPQAIFPCLIKSPRIPTSANGGGSPNNSGTSDYYRRTLKYITQLKLDMEDMKKRSVQKEDLKLMDENIVKIMEHVSGPDTNKHSSGPLDKINRKTRNQRNNRSSKLGFNISSPLVTSSKQSTKEKKILPTNVFKKGNKNSRFNTDILGKTNKKVGQTIAVNLCLCGTDNKSEKIAQKCKLMINDSQNDDKISSWKQTSSKIMAAHVSSIRQTKPINTNHFSPNIVYSSKTNVSDQPSCKKDCVCFHKLPSNTSIDRLLNILPKWKFLLRHSVENYVEETKTNKPKEDIKIINSITNNKSVPEKENDALNIRTEIGEATESMYCESKLNDNDLCSVSCYKKQEIIIKSDEAEHVIPANESEYMAAINLEQSNENCCQCLENTTKRVNDENTCKIKIPCNSISTNHSIGKQSIKSMNSKPMQQTVQISLQNKNENLHHNSRSNEHININNKQIQKDISITQNMQKKNMNELVNSEVCNSDYFINFLGVTLGNINSAKKNKSPVTQHSYGTKQSKISNYSVKNNTDCHRVLKCSPSKMIHENKLGEFNNFEPKDPSYIADESKTVASECKYNILNKHVEDASIGAHEPVGVSNLQNNIENLKSCICCNFNSLDESKNLEDNAFNLLEEYLKEKLKNFHKFSCKSSCISSEEEDKLFSGILQKVKEVISENVKQITCKCPESERIEGNWNRAYGLLQEYLKIKIKRVQCLCITKESTSIPVQNVLDRVSSLIDHDFKRLKTMCRCTTEMDKEEKNSNSVVCKDEIPVKDSNDYQQIQSLNENYSLIQIKTNSCGIVKLNTNTSFTNNHINNYVEQENKNLHNNYDKNLQSNTNNLNSLKSNNNYFSSDSNTINSAIDANKLSMQTSKAPIISNQNESCQVISNLGMVTKSCDALETYSKNVQTITMKSTDSFYKLSEYNTDCDCCRDLVKRDNIVLGFKRRELLVNPCTALEKNDDACSPIELHNTTSHDTKNIAFSSEKLNSSIDKITPYLGCTINCSCGEMNLSSCICFKSVVQKNHSIINDIWKSAIAKSCVEKMPYFLCSKNKLKNEVTTEPENYYKYITNESSRDVYTSEVTDDIKKSNTINMIETVNPMLCNAKLSVHGEEDLILKNSKENCEQMHNATNTLEESIPLDDYCFSIENPSDGQGYERNLITYKYKDSSHCSIDKDKFFSREENIIATNIVSLSNHSYHDCHCDVVPICHVKMLVENIENNLVNSCCTCDSLISDVCPAHSSNI